MSLSRRLAKIKCVHALGFNSLRRVLIYRLGVKFGFNPVKKIKSTINSGVFFNAPSYTGNEKLPVNDSWLGNHSYFGWLVKETNNIPLWNQNIFNQASVPSPDRNWWEISDFDPALGDIKGVWEASRFDWVICFAQMASQGDIVSLDKLNIWLNDWCHENPPYKGVNWKCGQEASIRVLHIATAAIILKQHRELSEALKSFVKSHMQRILPTINYAVGQDNNHGTSESAALFIGGSWLVSVGDKSGEIYYKKGRYWLENRAEKLIAKDGSFSQYSTNYHRVMLDTYSIVEVWRRTAALPKFSNILYERTAKATFWLYQYVQFRSGDVPNLGANDGARILPLTNTSYRDFRPSVQLAAALFCNKKAWHNSGSWDLPLKWLCIDIPKEKLAEQSSFHFPDGGYCGIRGDDGEFAMLTYPNFRYRPSQCDALHVDFWSQGVCLLRDGGTFSYNAGGQYIDYYGGSEGHNVVQFDDRQQMPRLSRFLLGNWLKAKDVKCELNQKVCEASYTDNCKATHQRRLSLEPGLLKIEDKISGFNAKAVLRWRLSPGRWVIKGHMLLNGQHSIEIKADIPILRFELKVAKESLFYYQETDIPMLEVEFNQAGKITTEYKY